MFCSKIGLDTHPGRQTSELAIQVAMVSLIHRGGRIRNIRRNREAMADPFTFFKEKHPLGENPWPPGTLRHDGWEYRTNVAKARLDSLWEKDYLARHELVSSDSEQLNVILTARLCRLDIVAEEMLNALPPVDNALIQEQESWIEDVVRNEKETVLALIQSRVEFQPFFSEDKFTTILLKKHQRYKHSLHRKAASLARQGLKQRIANHQTSANASVETAMPAEGKPSSNALSPETKEDRAARRHRKLGSLLKDKGVTSPEVWAQKAEGNMDKNTPRDYLNGTTKKLRRGTREALAAPLGIDQAELPD